MPRYFVSLVQNCAWTTFCGVAVVTARDFASFGKAPRRRPTLRIHFRPKKGRTDGHGWRILRALSVVPRIEMYLCVHTRREMHACKNVFPQCMYLRTQPDGLAEIPSVRPSYVRARDGRTEGRILPSVRQMASLHRPFVRPSKSTGDRPTDMVPTPSVLIFLRQEDPERGLI